MKFSGNYEIALPVCIKGLDPEDFVNFLNIGTTIVDEHVKIGNKMMRDHVTLNSMLTDKSSFEIIDLIEEGTSEDGYHIRLNAIIPVEIENLKCNGDNTAAMLMKVLEMVNMHVTCNDHTFKDLVDIEEATGIQEIISYDIQHDEPTLSSPGLGA